MITLKRLLIVIAIAAVSLSALGREATAQAFPPLESYSGTISAVGATPAIPLFGYNSCSVLISGSGTGFSIVAQTASDRAPVPWQGPTAASNATFSTNAGIATITANSASNVPSSGSIAPQGLTWFRLNVTAIASGTISYTETCSIGGASSGGGGGAGGTVAQGSPGPYAWSVTTPAPAATDAAGDVRVGPRFAGTNNAFYMAPIADSLIYTSAVITAATTVVVPGVSGENIFVYYIGVQASGAETSANQQWEYSTSSTCASGNTTLLPGTVGMPTTANQFTNYYSGSQASNQVGGFIPASQALVIPSGDTLCFVTSGSTIAAQGVVLYAQH